MSIPKIIHQTWRDDNIPERFQAFAVSWKRHHPSWEYQLWTDDRNRAFVREHYPQFLKRFDAYPYRIQRADAIRYLLLLTYGGLYVDLDFECLRSLESVVQDKESLFGLEPEEHCKIHGMDKIVGNALMACSPGHPFLAAILEDMLSFISLQYDRNKLILETTGPFMLTRVYNRCSFIDITLLASKYLYPLSIYDLDQIARNGWGGSAYQKLQEAYAIHHHAGTWWRVAEI